MRPIDADKLKVRLETYEYENASKSAERGGNEGISAKDVCKEIAKLFGSPCNYSPMDEIMLKNEECEKVCDKQTDEECWYRFFVYKLKEGD